MMPNGDGVDAVILAGDIDLGRNGLEWILGYFGTVPVVYVLGNHEFYGQTIPKLAHQLRDEAEGTNVHLLENGRVDIGEVTFLGATLWTDFALNGDAVIGGLHAESGMNDFRKIRTLPGYRRLRASYVARLHARSVAWLRAELPGLQGRKLVVVTHHAPSRRSIPDCYQTDPLNPAFASNAEELVASSGARLWVHGHIHRHADYMLADTRVLANPRGYPGEEVDGFDPNLVVEV